MRNEIKSVLSEISTLSHGEVKNYFRKALRNLGFEVYGEDYIHGIRSYKSSSVALFFTYVPEEFKIEGELVRGEGVFFNGSIAAFIAILSHNSPQNIEVIISDVSDRRLPEIESNSALVVYPTELKVANEQPALERLKIEISTAGGSSAYPEQGMSSLYRAIDVTERLRLLDIEVVSLVAKHKYSSLPSKAEIILDIWGRETGEMKKKVYRALLGLDCKFDVIENVDSFYLNEDEAIVTKLKKAIEPYGEVNMGDIRGSVALGNLNSKGVKAVAFGPGKAEMNLSKGEKVGINELVDFGNILGEFLRS